MLWHIVEALCLILFAGIWVAQYYYGVTYIREFGFSINFQLVERQNRPILYWTLLCLQLAILVIYISIRLFFN